MATINLKSADGKNTYVLTYTRKSVEMAEQRAGFELGEYLNGKGLIKNSYALFYGAFFENHQGIKRKVVDELYTHIEDKETLMNKLLEMYVDAAKSLIATDEDDKEAKNATWEVV